ncbi:MAG: hypothetical protein ACOYOB_09235 [Myxococcota bacterium]
MSDFTPTGRLTSWDGRAPDLRDWSDEDVLDGLRQLGTDTDQARFAERCAAAGMQSDIEEEWLDQMPMQDENFSVFVWMAARELWERWRVPAWPKDRLARAFLYLVDADYSAEWADTYHAPTALEVMDALDAWLGAEGRGAKDLEEMVELLGMPAAAWPGKMLDAMAEWAEIGNVALALRGGAFMARMLGNGHALGFLAAALVSARMFDRAQSAALEVPLDAPLVRGFDELVGYLCLSAGDAMLGNHWITLADKASGIRHGELTFAAEAVRDYLKEWRAEGGDRSDPATVPERIRLASRQGGAQACYYAYMVFAGTNRPGGQPA